MLRLCSTVLGLNALTLVGANLIGPLSATAQMPAKKAEAVKPSGPQRDAVRRTLKSLENPLAEMRLNRPDSADLEADARVLHRAASLMDEFDEYSRADDVAILTGLLAECESRRASIARGEAPWMQATGSVIRGYSSKLDGSIQPYVVEVPATLDRTKSARLDVILHGRNDGMNEARFIESHRNRKVPDERRFLTLHVFGRGNNAYRWAGEADVFEAIDAAKRNYAVDEDRIVLRGFSMGGAGAWHLGLHFPSRWCSVEAGAGFTETLRYAKLEGKPLPDWRRKALSIYDSIEYARNAFDVPIIGYGGEDDPQLQASTNIIDRLKADGVSFKINGLVTSAEAPDFRRVVGKGMGHKIDPASQTLLDAFHAEHAKKGVDRVPKRIRFVTYTLAYNTAQWIAVERMAEHYRRASVDAELAGEVARITTSNVSVLSVDRAVAESVLLDGVEMPLRLAAKGLLPRAYYRKEPNGWQLMDHESSIALIENVDRQKAPGVQGPIDDAFRAPFLVVTPTGTPWNPRADAWSKLRLGRFISTWRRHFRGEVRVKPDNEFTAEDIEGHHLVLFGDPGSNAVLGKILEGLPIRWSKERFGFGESYEGSTHAPAFIAANPLNPRRYVVVNSGMTFEAPDFAGTNAPALSTARRLCGVPPHRHPGRGRHVGLFRRALAPAEVRGFAGMGVILALIFGPLCTGAGGADEAERKAVSYLAAEVPRWARENHCYSCHNNGDAARALLRAKAAGLDFDESATRDTLDWLSRPQDWDRNGGRRADQRQTVRADRVRRGACGGRRDGIGSPSRGPPTGRRSARRGPGRQRLVARRRRGNRIARDLRQEARDGPLRASP